MQNEIIFIIDGKEVVTRIPVKDTPSNTKLNDKGLHTLSTKNSLKLSKHVQDTLGLKPLKDAKGNKVEGDKVGYSKSGDKVFIFKTDHESGKAITALGANQSYVRLNNALLWNDLGGNEKTTLKYELGEPVKSKDGKITAYELKLVSNTPKQQNSKKATGKGKGTVKRVRRAQVDTVETSNVLSFEFPFKKEN